MTRMTVGEVRRHWPKAEKALAAGEEIVVTRNARPVARIVPFVHPRLSKRRRFDPGRHARNMQRLWRSNRFGPSTNAWLKRDRSE